MVTDKSGAVFPQGNRVGQVSMNEGGMTRREYFAGQALVGVIMDQASWGVSHAMKAADFARVSVEIADALIAALAKP